MGIPYFGVKTVFHKQTHLLSDEFPLVLFREK